MFTLLTAAALTTATLASTAEAQSMNGWIQGDTWEAIAAGRDSNGEILQICREDDRDIAGMHPGKMQKTWNACNVSFDYKEHTAGWYQTLRMLWVPSTSNIRVTRGWEQPEGSGQDFCRASYQGGVQVGKRIAGDDACYFAWDGREVRVTSYEVLSSQPLHPVAKGGGTPIPDDAIVGGREADGTLLYLCMANFNGGKHLGKARRDWNGCHIGYGGVEQSVANFETLVPNFMNTTQDERYGIFRAGQDTNGQWLGICNASYKGSLQVGKFRPSTATCHIAYGGEELILKSGYKTLRY